MSDFLLDPRLAADSLFIADGPLSQIRLMDDARYPWLLLVPRVADIAEWMELDGNQQRLLLAEVNRAGNLIRALPQVEKLNIGALGNIVRQLHVHLVGRHSADPAWPGPVWGNGTAVRHEAGALATLREHWGSRLG